MNLSTWTGLMFEDRDHPPIYFNSQDPFFPSSLLCLSWEEQQQHQHWRNTTRSKLMENVINSSASWPWSLTLAAPILPRKPNSVIAIRETLHPFVFCCNPSQDIDGLPYFFVTSILRCFLVAKNICGNGIMITEAKDQFHEFELINQVWVDGSYWPMIL